MVRFRVSGISPTSLQWERKDDDVEIVRRLFNLLEDRRMLWKDFSFEIEEHWADSTGRRNTLPTSEVFNGGDGRLGQEDQRGP